MLLMDIIVMVSKLVHENMQEHKGPSLLLCETTDDTRLQPIIGNTESLKNTLMGIEIRRLQLRP